MSPMRACGAEDPGTRRAHDALLCVTEYLCRTRAVGLGRARPEDAAEVRTALGLDDGVDVLAGHEPGAEADHERASARVVPALRLTMRASTRTVGRRRAMTDPSGSTATGTKSTAGTDLGDGHAAGRHPVDHDLAGEHGLGEGDQTAHGQGLGALEDHHRKSGQEEEARGGRRQFPSAPHDHGRGRHHGVASGRP